MPPARRNHDLGPGHLQQTIEPRHSLPIKLISFETTPAFFFVPSHKTGEVSRTIENTIEVQKQDFHLVLRTVVEGCLCLLTEVLIRRDLSVPMPDVATRVAEGTEQQEVSSPRGNFDLDGIVRTLTTAD